MPTVLLTDLAFPCRFHRLTADAAALRLTLPVLAERRTTLLITTPGAAASGASDALRSRRGLGSSDAAAPEGWVCAGWVGATALPA
jgi:hypothetical protein